MVGREVFRVRLVNSVCCCSDLANSPVASVGWTASPVTVSSVVVEGAAMRNFCGAGSGASMEKIFAENTFGTVVLRTTYVPSPSASLSTFFVAVGTSEVSPVWRTSVIVSTCLTSLVAF